MNSTASLNDSYLRLLDFARSFNFVKTPAASDMNKTVRDLREVQGSALIIGGLAVAHYGLERTTEDVDILYENRDTDILKRLSKYFNVVKKAANGWSELCNASTGVRLEIIPEGGLSHYGFMPFCNTVQGADGYISLAGLLWLKVVAGRPQDDADVMRLIQGSPGSVLEVRAKLPPSLHERFDALSAKAQSALEHDPYRHPEKFMKRMLPDGTIIDLAEPHRNAQPPEF